MVEVLRRIFFCGSYNLCTVGAAACIGWPHFVLCDGGGIHFAGMAIGSPPVAALLGWRCSTPDLLRWWKFSNEYAFEVFRIYVQWALLLLVLAGGMLFFAMVGAFAGTLQA